jgi:hypothetical protein
MLAAVPVGGSPTGAGEPPVPPIFKTGSKYYVSNLASDKGELDRDNDGIPDFPQDRRSKPTP